jgi:uncharacterized membrane protein YfcA
VPELLVGIDWGGGPLFTSAILAVLVGVVMGLFGGGGSVLSVPLLLYVTKLEAHAAIAVSLFMVSASSALGAIVHARTGRVRVQPALVMAIFATGFAFAGGFVARHFPPWLLLGGFSLLMIGTSIRMLGTDPASSSSAHVASPMLLALTGALTGFVAGMVGAGGGFMVVPALVLLAGLEIHDAVGTSLFVIAFSAFAGFLGHSVEVPADLRVLALVTVPSLFGVVIGARLAERMPSKALRRGFGGLILILGLFLLYEQLPVGLD